MQFTEEEFEAFLAATALPETPAEAFEKTLGLGRLVRSLDRAQAAATLAGLLTHPPLQSNLNRIDAALRMVLSTASGRAQATRSVLSTLCNKLLVQAGCVHREDPPENLFVQRVVTPFGDFRAFPGVTNAGVFDSECVIEAFTRLPDDPQKDAAIRIARTALLLSDALVSRCGLDEGVLGEDRAFQDIVLPPHLRTLSRRVLFTPGDIAALSISAEELEPLLLSERDLGELAEQRQGDSWLEIRPILPTAEGLLIAAPHCLALAASAHLIDAALMCGMGEALRNRLREVSGSSRRYSTSSIAGVSRSTAS